MEENYINTSGYKIGGGQNKEVFSQSSNVNQITGRYVVYTFKDKNLAREYSQKLDNLQKAGIPTIGSQEQNLKPALSKQDSEYSHAKISGNKIFVLDIRHNLPRSLVFSRFADSRDQFMQFVSSFVQNTKDLENISLSIKEQVLKLADLCSDNGFWIGADSYMVIFNQVNNQAEVIIGDLDTVNSNPIEVDDEEDEGINLYNRNRAIRYFNILKGDIDEKMLELQDELKNESLI